MRNELTHLKRNSSFSFLPIGCPAVYWQPICVVHLKSDQHVDKKEKNQGLSGSLNLTPQAKTGLTITDIGLTSSSAIL